MSLKRLFKTDLDHFYTHDNKLVAVCGDKSDHSRIDNTYQFFFKEIGSTPAL